VAYYAIAVFLSALLLFQVEPMMGKYILPWFGGTPAVWSTTMLFFQVALTGGYAYAHWLVARLGSRSQALVHTILLIISLTLLALTALAWNSPITPDASWKPAGVDMPITDIFKILVASVGLPFFLLSTNGPLVQAWFSRAWAGRSPYRLYALSNAGSLLALVCYPILVEPNLTLRAQGWFWSVGYVAFTILAIYGVFKHARYKDTSPAPARVEPEQAGFEEPAPSLRIRLVWIALAACASVLLLATTSQITQEVAVIPFLWVLPLIIYLLTFILCFDSDRWYSRTKFTVAFVITSVLYCYVLAVGARLDIPVQIGAYSLVLFVGCMICHGELTHLKPHPRYLTLFYFMVSVGGAVGGIAVSLFAPYVFKEYWELPLGLLACAGLLLMLTLLKRPQNQRVWVTRNYATVLAGAIVLLGGFLLMYVQSTTGGARLVSRNFYGVLRVNEINPEVPEERAYRLAHGMTNHGLQFVSNDKRRLPTTYFTESSGIGLAILNHPRRPAPLRIGVLGLGIGILAAYGQPGDVVRFYEINPEVIQLAEGEGGFFTYLKETPARVEVIPGDARISLEKELAAGQAQNFDILVVDTFNGDSIPIHLITQQALQVYLRHLEPDGILAMQISNLHLDLRPVVWRLADEFHLSANFIETPGEPGRGYLSSWMLLTRNQGFLQQPGIASRSIPRSSNASPEFPLWTDDYSNLFQILR
jgi:hypothetical protein